MLEIYNNMKTSQKNEMARFYGFTSEPTFRKWIRDDDTPRLRLLEIMVKDFFREQSTLEFNRVDEEVWLLLDFSKVTLAQAHQISEILSLSKRDKDDFERGRRFEVLVSQAKIKPLLGIFGK
jgi:hypothetical protein